MESIGFRLSCLPCAGSHPSSWAKTHCSMSANQNTGMETPIKAMIMAKKSNQVFCFQALIIPAFTPITTAKIIAKKVNSKVAARYGHISLTIAVLSVTMYLDYLGANQSCKYHIERGMVYLIPCLLLDSQWRTL